VRRPPAVARVLERVTLTARTHDLFLPGRAVLVAVSGGPDSVCLMESLVRLRRLFKYQLAVAHVDHRLREGSGADAAYVRRLADRLGLPFHLHVAASGPPPGASVEAWARDLRKRALATYARDLDAGGIALGHTQDDQAETVLLNLVTGSGLRGLAGIRYAARPWINPLLDVTRPEVVAFCRSLGLRPRQDPSNEDRRFLRNALRLEGLPALERTLGRGLREPLARTAATLAEDAEELARQAAAVADDVITSTPEGIELHAVHLLDLPRALSARVAAQAVYACGGICTRADVEAVLDLAAGRPGRRRDLSGGVAGRRGRAHVHLLASLDSGP
jgi:tRNA(Ile)-lysidine synthetase-like protein